MAKMQDKNEVRLTKESAVNLSRLPGDGAVVPRLTAALRRDIAVGRLLPGSRLKIEQIRRSYGVSPASVREALSILTGEEFVTSVDQRGFKVTVFSAENLADLSKVRAELECTAFAWSVERSDMDWRAKIVATHFALSEVEELLLTDPHENAMEWDKRNSDFHMALAGACGSPRLMSLISTHYDLTRRYRLIALADDIGNADRIKERNISAREHLALKEAALAGDSTTGQSILRSHIIKKE